MSEQNWVTLITVHGELNAELLRGLLESQEIPVQLSQEGVARVYGIAIGPLGEVDLLVPEYKLTEAQEVIQAYESGELEELGNQLDENQLDEDEELI